ncbi:MAG: CpsD/CapB family tyrosine-protein kinase, partial [Terracidiphilus sp.]
ARLRTGTGSETGSGVLTSVLDQPQGEIADAYRSIRTALQLSSPGAPPKVILVTSALPREGKTTTSVNLAAVYSQNNNRVLLVDGDLRRADLCKYFKLERNKGLSSALAGEEPELFYATHPKLPNLTILPAGPRPPQPPDMLDSDRMREFVKRWRAARHWIE